MGLGIVLMFWGVMGVGGAAIGSLILPRIISHFTRGNSQVPRRLLQAARALPFASLAWAGGAFVFYALVNETVFHRDPGIGDGWTCPLPNGYQVEMIDVTDQGILYNPKTQDINSVDALQGVRLVQIAAEYMAGASDSRHIDHTFAASRSGTAPGDSFFLLDTRTGERNDFQTLGALREAANKFNIRLNLEPIGTLYRRYRFTWFDALAAVLIIGVPLLGGLLLLRWVLRIRRTPRLATELA